VAEAEPFAADGGDVWLDTWFRTEDDAVQLPHPDIQRSYTVSAYMKSNGQVGQFDLQPPTFPPTCGLFTPKAAFGQKATFELQEIAQ